MSDQELVEILTEIKFQYDIIISLLARKIFDAEKVREDITKGAKDKKRLVKCFNLCDGKTTLTDIAQTAKIDQGGLSRQVDSWEKDGYVIKMKIGQKTFPKALIRIP